VLLNLRPDAAQQRFDELIQEGHSKRLGLEQRYWVWQRTWGLVLFTRPDWVSRYNPVAMLRLSARGTNTAGEITVIAPSFLVMLACLVAAAGLIGKFRYWGAISEMALAMFGVHVLTYILYRGELRDIADDLAGVIADAMVDPSGR
jgi:hypothetical protein